MINVGAGMVKADNEELGLGLEITQLQYEVDTRCDGACGIDGLTLFGAQIKVALAIPFAEMWQAIKAVHLFGGENGKALGGLYRGACQD
jgi:hypothetical protein